MERNLMEARLQSLALKAFVKLSRAADTVISNVHQHLSEDGITVSQFGVLEALFHFHTLNMCDLGRKILRSNANLTTVVDNLEKRDLVRRQKPPEDRRQVQVTLTDTGKALISRVFPRHAQIVTEEMGFLTIEELEDLSRLCKKLGKRESCESVPEDKHNSRAG